MRTETFVVNWSCIGDTAVRIIYSTQINVWTQMRRSSDYGRFNVRITSYNYYFYYYHNNHYDYYSLNAKCYDQKH